MRRGMKIAAAGVVVLAALLLMVLAALPAGRPHAPPRTTEAMAAAAETRTASTGEAVPATGPTPATGVATAAADAAARPYTVTMSPMGPVTFARVPRRVVTQDANYNDMLVAAGTHHRLVATGFANNRYDGFFQQLAPADAAIDYDRVKFLSNGAGALFDKETLYGLKADVHHIDPVQLAASRGWSAADVEEIARNVGPFFANRYSRVDDYKGRLPYEYYGVWQIAGKVGEVYRRADRVARLKAVYDRMHAAVQAKLPPPDKRPRVGLVIYSKTGFLPFVIAKGFGTEQYRAVGAVDAFAGVGGVAYGNGNAGGRLDVEGMLSIDPDVLISPFGVLPGMRPGFEELRKLKSDPLAGRLKAFKGDHVYPGGTPLEGPLFSLFQLEMAAKQIYPDRFGPFRDDQQYPEAERLFDRRQVAAILDEPVPGEAGSGGAGR